MVETEQSFTYAEFRDAFTRKWNLYQGRKVDTPVIIGADGNGTHFFWEDERGDRHYGVISDLSPLSFTFDVGSLRATLYDFSGNSISALTSTPLSTARGLTVRLPAVQ